MENTINSFSRWFWYICNKYKVPLVVRKGAASMMANLPVRHYKDSQKNIYVIGCLRISWKFCFDGVFGEDLLFLNQETGYNKINWTKVEMIIMKTLHWNILKYFDGKLTASKNPSRKFYYEYDKNGIDEIPRTIKPVDEFTKNNESNNSRTTISSETSSRRNNSGHLFEVIDDPTTLIPPMKNGKNKINNDNVINKSRTSSMLTSSRESTRTSSSKHSLNIRTPSDCQSILTIDSDYSLPTSRKSVSLNSPQSIFHIHPEQDWRAHRLQRFRGYHNENAHDETECLEKFECTGPTF